MEMFLINFFIYIFLLHGSFGQNADIFLPEVGQAAPKVLQLDAAVICAGKKSIMRTVWCGTDYDVKVK